MHFVQKSFYAPRPIKGLFMKYGKVDFLRCITKKTFFLLFFSLFEFIGAAFFSVCSLLSRFLAVLSATNFWRHRKKCRNVFHVFLRSLEPSVSRPYNSTSANSFCKNMHTLASQPVATTGAGGGRSSEFLC